MGTPTTRSAEAVRLAREGLPYSVIGERLGITRQAVRQAAARAGVPPRNPGRGWAQRKDPEARVAAHAAWLRVKATRLLAEADRIEAKA